MPGLETSEKVHAAMMRGTISKITMGQCADTHGPHIVEQFHRWDALRQEIKAASNILMDFAGKTIWQQAQHAVEHIAYLRRAAAIAQYNENAALNVCEQNAREIQELKQFIARLTEGRGQHVEEARQVKKKGDEDHTHEEQARSAGEVR